MKNVFENIFGFLYTLSMGDYIFFVGTLTIILAFLYVLYLIKREDENTSNISSLEEIKNNIEKNYKPESVILTEYEKEQEKSAIISYEELISNKDRYVVSYDDEYNNNNEEIEVKKININNTNSKLIKEEKLNVKLFSYEKEEAFLIALKQLQQNLLN